MSNIKCDTGPTHPLGRHFSYPRLFADFDLRRFAQSLSSSSVGRCAVSHFLHETESDLFIVAAAVAEPQIVLYVLGQSNVRLSAPPRTPKSSATANELDTQKSRVGRDFFYAKGQDPRAQMAKGKGVANVKERFKVQPKMYASRRHFPIAVFPAAAVLPMGGRTNGVIGCAVCTLRCCSFGQCFRDLMIHHNAKT